MTRTHSNSPSCWTISRRYVFYTTPPSLKSSGWTVDSGDSFMRARRNFHVRTKQQHKHGTRRPLDDKSFPLLGSSFWLRVCSCTQHLRFWNRFLGSFPDGSLDGCSIWRGRLFVTAEACKLIKWCIVQKKRKRLASKSINRNRFIVIVTSSRVHYYLLSGNQWGFLLGCVAQYLHIVFNQCGSFVFTPITIGMLKY